MLKIFGMPPYCCRCGVVALRRRKIWREVATIVAEDYLGLFVRLFGQEQRVDVDDGSLV